MTDRKMVQISAEAHAALKAEKARTGRSMYDIASEALSGACGDDLRRVGYMLRQLGADEGPGACVDVLAYILSHHGE